MYYVYEFYIVDTNEIIYVGKGKGNRYKTTYGRNALLKQKIKDYVCDSRIIKYFESEQEAFEYETERINELKAIGQCTCNIHSGGAGGSGEYWTDELRKEYSEYNVMKDEKQRKRMSEKNPMKNPEVAKKVASKKSKPVIIGNKEYSSVKEASEDLHTDNTTIRLWCKKGINSKGELCRYKDEEQVIFTDKRYNKGGSKPIIFKGKRYEAVIDLCRDINISENTVHEWLRRGFTPQGISVRYENDTRELVFEDRHVKRNKARAKRIIINGITYDSCEDASIKLNIPKPTIYSYLQGRNYNPKYICEYDNQQPSQENSDNSILEGSETNG